MRVAFTIIYNGLHHLKHNNFADKMASMFDYWAVVEGHSLPYGSTRWCNRLDVNKESDDGTIEFMNEFCKSNNNTLFYSHGDYFHGKDQQVNLALSILRAVAELPCYLWEVDVDEQWNIESIEKAEQVADHLSGNGFSFHFNHYVGKDIIADGEWGGNTLNRLWKWRGENFKSHEPALLQGQRYVTPITGVKFNHYSYYFEKDVKFKSLYYKGHQNVLKNWSRINTADSYPIHISEFFGSETSIGKTNTYINKINSHV
jgi:hypothetical protein